jgi:two-component system sensor histidine kinase KdpD
VQNLLDMTRLGYGALQPKKEWSDVREIIGRAVQQACKYAQDRDISVQIDPVIQPLFVDPVLLEQVVFNVLDNAVKHTAANGHISIVAKLLDHKVNIAIIDDGPGIPGQDREAVFDVFYRVKAGDRQTAGTGLGLSICRGFVEAHGGQIKALAGPKGLGARIEITLPIAEIPALPKHETDDDEDFGGKNDL